MTRTLIPIITLCALAAAPRVATAAVPARVAVQGFLTNTAGTPVDGNQQIELRLYTVASGGTAWFAETQIVGVDRGALTVYLGAVQTLDLAGFAGGAAYLGITLAGETEMTPRLPIGSVPYAAYASYADECGSVPTGSVMYFDLDQCPTGWSAFDPARGRAIVGTPTSGTRGGTVGTPFTDLENRTHAHTVDPASVTSTAAGAHTHTVDPGQVSSSVVDLSHSHTVNPPAFNITGGSHNHVWAQWNQATLEWTAFDVNGVVNSMVNYSNGFTNTGSGSYPIEDNGGATADEYTQNSTHSHVVDIPSTTSSGASTNMAHAHNVDIASTTSSQAADHTHAVDVGATTSSATSATTPYVQLLACRKN